MVPGAHSLIKNQRIANCKKFAEYERWVFSNCPITSENSETLTPGILYEESIWLGLRTIQGINLESLLHNFNYQPSIKKLNSWEKLGYLERYGNCQYRLKEKGWIYLDEITADILAQ